MFPFYVDYEQNIKNTYYDLYNDLISKSTIKKYIYEKNTYNFFKELLFCILQEIDTIILDGDFSKEEIERLGFDYSSVIQEYDIQNLSLSFEEFLEKLALMKGNGRISLYTSGTTGFPKRVTHNLGNLVRNVKVGERFKDNIWGFAYNATHYAGLQVFFQAITNHNPIINLFNQQNNKIQHILLEKSISHISATSTFYRTILPYLDKPIENVRYITFGGEKYDDSLYSELNKYFPNAKIRNIYASTEAGSLFTAKGNSFIIPVNLKPYVSISDDNELMIHRSLLGDINNGNGLVKVDEWFHTGDIIEKQNDHEFIIVSRMSEIINVGGYNVNPYEIEEILCKLPYVVDAVVKARANRVTGNIIVADVVIKESFDSIDVKKMIKEELSSKLQAWRRERA